MRKRVREILIATLAAGCSGQEQGALVPIEAVFAAAREDDASGLAGLCDPEGRADTDARRICAAHPDDAHDWALFREWFAGGRILGIAAATEDPHELHVAVAIGPDHRRVEVTVVRRGERWYLLRL